MRTSDFAVVRRALGWDVRQDDPRIYADADVALARIEEEFLQLEDVIRRYVVASSRSRTNRSEEEVTAAATALVQSINGADLIEETV